MRWYHVTYRDPEGPSAAFGARKWESPVRVRTVRLALCSFFEKALMSRFTSIYARVHTSALGASYTKAVHVAVHSHLAIPRENTVRRERLAVGSSPAASLRKSEMQRGKISVYASGSIRAALD